MLLARENLADDDLLQRPAPNGHNLLNLNPRERQLLRQFRRRPREINILL